MPNYTWEMYYGNKPAGKGHRLACGGFADRWDCRYGEAETTKEKILHATFNMSSKVTLFVCRDILHIVDRRYAGKPDCWELCVNCSGMICLGKSFRHALEHEKIVKFLRKDYFDCKIWDMVHARATELYERHLHDKGGVVPMPL